MSLILETAIRVDFGKRLKRDKRARTDKGCYPSISLNDGGTVLEVNHLTATNLMFYRVGQRRTSYIEWEKSDSDAIKPPRKKYYGSGAYPRVSLNNDNVVIAVRKGQFLDRCYYRVGRVDVDARTVAWGPSVYFNVGLYPDVALNSVNTVIALVQDNVFTKHLNYRVGTLDRTNNRVSWKGPKHKAGVYSESSFSLDVNDAGIVVLSFQTPLTHHIHYRVGKVDAEAGMVEWQRSVHKSVGFSPCVSINNSNQVLQIHQSLMKRHLVCNVGVARWSEDFKGIDWSTEETGVNYRFGKGIYPSVAINDYGELVEVHEPRFAPNKNRLHYYVGELEAPLALLPGAI